LKIQVKAMSDRGVYLAYEDGEGYLVFSLDDTRDIEPGDILSHQHWDDREGLWKHIRNVTQDQDDVYICLENWSMNRELAYELLGRLNKPSSIRTIER
jgi:hypothetical protein